MTAPSCRERRQPGKETEARPSARSPTGLCIRVQEIVNTQQRHGHRAAGLSAGENNGLGTVCGKEPRRCAAIARPTEQDVPLEEQTRAVLGESGARESPHLPRATIPTIAQSGRPPRGAG